MEILTEAQRRFLRVAASVETFRSSFFLTGGTALAAFFLRHRWSEDLDLFTAVPKAVPLAVAELRGPIEAAGFGIEIVRRFPTFAELRVAGAGEVLKIDLAEDTPFRLAPVDPGRAEGVDLDSLEDIAANKLAALFGRAEPKDFVDTFFLAKERLPLAELVEQARKKHIGMDDYWFAQAYARVRTVSLLPRMIRSVDLHEMKTFFLAEADRLMRATTI